MCVYEDMSYEYLRTRRNVQQINTIRKFNQTQFVGTRTEINTAHIVTDNSGEQLIVSR